MYALKMDILYDQERFSQADSLSNQTRSVKAIWFRELRLSYILLVQRQLDHTAG